MLDKRIKRRHYLLFSDLSVSSIAVAEDPQLPDDGGDRQGDPAPDGLLEGDGEVRATSARVRRTVREAGPGVSRGIKPAASASLPE